ncbi:carbamoyltransferase N-terminal domain-containing protein [Streptomyces sp. NPDC086077]|uniref:carbamoyltransferase N-terminal domain-containing protein n=1 Tax=Streptomyces sp. NPDC086077 TaxID=3154862 RepID=UPI0034306E79
MLICGVKASHDGGVALIDEGRLVFSIEVEKIANAARYSALGNLDRVASILRGEGIDPADVDRFVVDGWWAEGGGESGSIPTRAGDHDLILPVAPYVDGGSVLDPLERHTFSAYNFHPKSAGYSSYHHASNHLLASYCTSPFAARGEDSLALVWDGAMTPRVYHVSARDRSVKPVSLLMPLSGNIFSDFCSHFEPFYQDMSQLTPEEYLNHHLSIAGKAMAYAALGKVEESGYVVFDKIVKSRSNVSRDLAFEVGREVAQNRDEWLPGMTNADIIATFQAYLGKLLLDSLTTLMHRRFPRERHNLCLGGGCALNIKWSSLIRQSGLFSDVWIPPFPNDAGAAIGTACCEMFRETEHQKLDWDVYSGPQLVTNPAPADWQVRMCDERQLAQILHTEGEPVVVLSGRAELGPRALGNRSILAPATDVRMRNRLNDIKGRADYRPVAPICLESRAAEIFNPGSSDRYMVFEHTMKEGWAERIPAIVHLDGTARLQTISTDAGSAAHKILTEYEKLSGIPVLCNTSANLNGSGFFPDVASASRWGRTKYIWSDGLLYVNPVQATPTYSA